MTSTPDRDVDVVLFGATGFVGRLTAAELARVAPPGLRIALAGRDLGRVDAVRTGLGDAAAGWTSLALDATDTVATAALARRSRVVVTTVGPYARYGRPLVDACAAAGTHYADLTGEVLFVRDSIEANHARARETGARIVHACGFDSIPSDLGVLLTAQAAADDAAGTLGRATLRVLRMSGGFSGGTIDSARQQLAAISADPRLRGIVADPYALSPDRDREPDRTPGPAADAGSRAGTAHPATADPGPSGLTDLPAQLVRRARRSLPIGLDPSTHRWTAPFVMASFNTRIVRRSNALTGWSYGRGFRYAEVVDTGPGPSGALRAAAVAGGLGAVFAGMALPGVRTVVDRMLPAPGEGPSDEAMARGRFEMAIDAVTESGAAYRSVVSARRDPGYGGTAVMLAQAALALALDDLPAGGGVVTPATGIGLTLADRLRAQDFTLRTERVG